MLEYDENVSCNLIPGPNSGSLITLESLAKIV